MKVQIRFPVV